MDSSSKSLVRVNVGGTWYTTTRTTLEAKPHSIFPKMLAEQAMPTANKNNNKDGQGYYFIDRDGDLFKYILNYLRCSQLNLPSDFSQHAQLVSEAKFYGLAFLEERILKHATTSKISGGISGSGSVPGAVSMVEIVEVAHPEKIGVCSARVVLTEDQQESVPFCDIISASGAEHEAYQGLRGRAWVRTNVSRLEWGEVLRLHGWRFVGMTSYTRRIADITGHGSDLCHVVEKWELGRN